MMEPWRYTCPNGHVNIYPRQNGSYYCRTCHATYPYRVDKKTGRRVTKRRAVADVQ